MRLTHSLSGAQRRTGTVVVEARRTAEAHRIHRTGPGAVGSLAGGYSLDRDSTTS